MRAHSDSKGVELKRPNNSIYSFPCPNCMCHINRTEDSKTSAPWFLTNLFFWLKLFRFFILLTGNEGTWLHLGFETIYWLEKMEVFFRRFVHDSRRKKVIFYGVLYNIIFLRLLLYLISCNGAGFSTCFFNVGNLYISRFDLMIFDIIETCICIQICFLLKIS